MPNPSEMANNAEALADKVAPIFAGIDPDIVGGALADLVATLITGHVIPGDPRGTADIRRKLLALHVATVKELMRLYDKRLQQEGLA